MKAMQKFSLSAPISFNDGCPGLNGYLAPDLWNLRSTSSSDLPALSGYFKDLSENSRRLRFQVWTKEVPTSVLRLYEGSDLLQVSGFALYRSNGDNTIVGEGILTRSSGANSVEIGVSIADSWRGLGVGKLLIASLIAQAVKNGYRTIYADTLWENTPFIRVTSSLGFKRRYHPDEYSQARMTLDLVA